MFKNFLAILTALALIIGPDIPKIFADSTDPNGQINWPRFVASIVGAFIAAWLVKTKQPPTAIGEKTEDRQKDAGHVLTPVMLRLGMLGAIVSVLWIAALANGCATTSKFANVVVECTEDTITNNPTIASNVRACLADATAGGYMACLNLLPFGVQDIICIVSELSRGTARAINGGDVDPVTATINANANEFLRTQNISRK